MLKTAVRFDFGGFSCAFGWWLIWDSCPACSGQCSSVWSHDLSKHGSSYCLDRRRHPCSLCPLAGTRIVALAARLCRDWKIRVCWICAALTRYAPDGWMPVDDFYTAFSSLMRCYQYVFYQSCDILTVLLFLPRILPVFGAFFCSTRCTFFITCVRIASSYPAASGFLRTEGMLAQRWITKRPVRGVRGHYWDSGKRPWLLLMLWNVNILWKVWFTSYFIRILVIVDWLKISGNDGKNGGLTDEWFIE